MVVDSVEVVQPSRQGSVRSSRSVVSAIIATVLAVWVLARGPCYGMAQAFSVILVVLSCLAALVGLRLGMARVFSERTDRAGRVIGILWNGVVIAFWILAGIAICLNW